MTTKKSSKKPTKKELETKQLRKQWRSMGFSKVMPFANFRKLASTVKITYRAIK